MSASARWHAGDGVFENDNELGLYNGDTVVIVEFEPEGALAVFDRRASCCASAR